MGKNFQKYYSLDSSLIFDKFLLIVNYVGIPVVVIAKVVVKVVAVKVSFVKRNS